MTGEHQGRFVVTGANGDIGDAVGRLLRDAFPHATLVGADASGSWPAADVYDEVHVLPLARAPEYLDELRVLATDEPDVLVVPTTEPEILRLAGVAPEALPDVLMSAPELVMRFSDKLDTVRWLEGHGLPAPATWELHDATGDALPLVVKPRVGSGSRGVEVVRTAERLAAVQEERPGGHVAQELLEPDDAELTCAIVRTAGETRTLQLRRVLHGGMTVRAVVERDRPTDDLLHAIAEASALDGLMNVQLRLTATGPRVFEINPRISSTVLMRHRLGFADLQWLIEARGGRPLPDHRPPVGTRVFRMSREVVAPPC